MQYLARAFSDSDVVFTRQTVLFNAFKDKHTKYRIALFLYLINCIKHCIWIQLSSCIFDGVQVNTDTILTLFIKQINFRMSADRSRFPRSMYIKYWGNNESVSVCSD